MRAEVRLPDAEATRALGRQLAAVLRAGDLVVLVGGLGAGKTTLAQGIGEGLGVRGQVHSPTFVIARTHRSAGDGPALVHVDAYRLGDLDEIDALDLDASLEESVTVVEWGAGLVEQLAQDRLLVELVRPRGVAGAGSEAAREGDDGGAGPAEPARRAVLAGIGSRWEGVEWAPA